MFGVVPRQIWQKINPPDDNNRCTWAMRCLLVEENDRLILIDTGIGNKQDEKFLGHYHLHGEDTLENSVRRAGFSPADITDVVLTHLHFDHCGGAIVRTSAGLQPAFPKAVYWSNASHWKWATYPNPREKASFLDENIRPIADSGRLKFVAEEQGVQFSASIRIRFAYGHTEAMMIPEIRYGDKTLVYMADLLPSVGHLPLPYVMAYDLFPLKTMSEKDIFLQEAANCQYILYFEHDPVHECCTVHHTEKGVRLKEVFTLGQITG